jgi:hypothetical protein
MTTVTQEVATAEKKTRVRVSVSEWWTVPHGFGRHYARCASDPAPLDVLRDILGLVGYDASEAYLRTLTLFQRVELEVHAAREHASASDAPIRRLPRPSHLPPPWRGHVFRTDEPTVLRAPTESQ